MLLCENRSPVYCGHRVASTLAWSGTGDGMSLVTPLDGELRSLAAKKVTPPSLIARKESGHRITALTAYDYGTARLIDEAGIDCILVGDSLGMVVLGYEDTLSVTIEDMLHHARAVRRGVRRALLVVDMPFGSYHVSTEDTLRNGIRLLKEAGAEAVKVEGGMDQVENVRALTAAQIPVFGHIGLTPQSVLRTGGYRVQGRSHAAALALREDALALQEAGAVAVVLEGIPREVAASITARLRIPTIGIGAGPDCDGQILVFQDLADLSFRPSPKFVRVFSPARTLLRAGLEEFRVAVENGTFPADSESYHMPSGVPVDVLTSL
ncbi:3-methyl-2-oxobutanoate hydroxymethyltransferase [Terriglobus aquaticus]|nr:3-methyl-2-oxobutanoate hydroxymethyltransferase [Terriglobus aquaticus]